MFVCMSDACASPAVCVICMPFVCLNGRCVVYTSLCLYEGLCIDWGGGGGGYKLIPWGSV